RIHPSPHSKLFPYTTLFRSSPHGATRTQTYLAKNPNGKVPMIETDDGRVMVESNAILTWLADGTKYFGGDAWQRAQTLAWMFFEDRKSTRLNSSHDQISYAV